MFRILELITNYAYFSVLHFKNTFIKYSEISVKCTEGSLFICDLLLLMYCHFFTHSAEHYKEVSQALRDFTRLYR